MDKKASGTDQPQDDCFGYYFHAPQDGNEWGSNTLEVNLRSKPSGKHFDPEILRLPIARDDNQIAIVRIHHDWPGANRLQVLFGEVVLRDRRDKVIEAFTFGGTLEIETTNDCTLCTLSSPVPIIDRRDQDPMIQMLAEEAMALIARLKADWKSDTEEFEKRLIQLDVEALFVGVLKELFREFQSSTRDDRTKSQEFLNFLHHAIKNAGQQSTNADPLSSLEPSGEPT